MRAIYTYKNKQEMENILLYTSHFPTSHTNKLFLFSKRPQGPFDNKMKTDRKNN